MAAGSTTFDPAVETARYLATLSPEAHAKATAYTQGGHWLLLWSALVAVAVAWLIIRSGLLVRLRARIEGHRKRPWLTALVVLPVALLMESVLTLPWTVYESWWREKSYGMTDQPLGGWVGEWAMSAAIGLVFGTLLFMAVYWLLRRAPKTWWLWASGVTGLFLVGMLVLTPIYIAPLFNEYKPAPDGPVRDAVVALAKANGVPSDKIYVYNGSKQSNRYTANVNGLFGSAQVNMSDTMFKAGADMTEIRAVVGHEMGHYARQHILWMLGAMTLLAIVGFWLLGRLFEPAARLLGASGVQGISDPAGLPVFSLLLTLLFLVATPLTNSITRLAEIDADNYSLRTANEPDGLAKALVQTIEYRAASPGKLEEILFYDHPSVSWRIRNGMEWKAAHPATPKDPASGG